MIINKNGSKAKTDPALFGSPAAVANHEGAYGPAEAGGEGSAEGDGGGDEACEGAVQVVPHTVLLEEVLDVLDGGADSQQDDATHAHLQLLHHDITRVATGRSTKLMVLGFL